MSLTRKSCLALAFPLLLGGCSGGGDAPASSTPKPAASLTPAATATASAVPTVSATPSTDLTPGSGVSPLGGKPLSEAEKEYSNRKLEAKDMGLAGNHAAAIPVFEELLAKNPEDVEVLFYLVRSHGSLEEAPSKKSKAYGYAEQILKIGPGSREAEKARSYINTANLELPENFPYKMDTMVSMGNWVFDPGDTFKTSAEIPFHSTIGARPSPAEQTALWETEASPATAVGIEKLPKGAEVKVLAVKDFLYSLTSWRKPLKVVKDKFDKSMFDVTAMYVEVTSEGPLKGKKGWIVNHVDRYLATDGDGWGAWISNRLKVPRESDLAAETPGAKKR